MVSAPVGFSRSHGGYGFATRNNRKVRGPDLASSQTVPADVCASKGAKTPRGEQASRHQSSTEPKKRIRWSISPIRNCWSASERSNPVKGENG